MDPYYYDTLYYSNLEQFSPPVLLYINRNQLAHKMNCICVDKKWQDHTGTFIVQLPNGNSHALPPGVHSVPTLLAKRTREVFIGEKAIIGYFEPIGQRLPIDFTQRGEPAPAGLVQQIGGLIGNQEPALMTVPLTSANNLAFTPVNQPGGLSFLEPEKARPDKLTPAFIDQAHVTRTRDAQRFETENEANQKRLATLREEREGAIREIKSGYVFPSDAVQSTF